MTRATATMPKSINNQATEIYRINDKQWDYTDYRLSVVSVFAFMVTNKLKAVSETVTYENGIKVYTIEVEPESIN